MDERFVPLTPRTGARVAVPREELFSPAFSEALMQALGRYGVLVFPGVDFDDEEQVAFSQNLGEIMPFGDSLVYKITIDPEVNPEGAEYLKTTIGFHIDGLFQQSPPPRASLLSARRLASEGGDTEFCNTYAAYEDLSEADQRLCETLRIHHTLEASERDFNPNPTAEDSAEWERREAQRESRGRLGAKDHPLVWQHKSGRKSLVLGMTVDHVVDMPAAESRSLVERLTAHTTRPENVYRHEWQPGDAVMWDNCGVMHRATPYSRESGRLMHRTTLYGDEMIEGVDDGLRKVG